jgi:hypothetical protein
MNEVLHKKKVIELEYETQQSRKLDTYFEKAEKIKESKKNFFISTRGSKMHDISFDDLIRKREEQSKSIEIHLQEKISRYEEKMMRASYIRD